MRDGAEAATLEIDCRSVSTRLEAGDELMLLDCREREEYAVVHLEGAMLIPMSELQQRAGELDPHQGAELIVYCHHGGRSLQVAMWLRGRGFARVKSMAGGIDQWAIEIDSSLPRY